MGENFPEGTSASGPSAVPPFDPETLEEEPEEQSSRQRDEELGDVGRDDPSEETDAEEAPESQQAG